MTDFFRQLVNFLKKECPPAFPVSVRRTKMPEGISGRCYRGEESFSITIDKDSTEMEAIDTLLHEFAHALSWNHIYDNLDQEEFDKRIHDGAWGIAYSEVYRAYERFISIYDAKRKKK